MLTITLFYVLGTRSRSRLRSRSLGHFKKRKYFFLFYYGRTPTCVYIVDDHYSLPSRIPHRPTHTIIPKPGQGPAHTQFHVVFSPYLFHLSYCMWMRGRFGHISGWLFIQARGLVSDVCVRIFLRIPRAHPPVFPLLVREGSVGGTSAKKGRLIVVVTGCGMARWRLSRYDQVEFNTYLGMHVSSK